MKQVQYEVIEAQSTVTLTSIIYEYQSYGRRIWIFQLRLTRQRFVWHWSRFHDSRKHQVIEDVMDMWMVSPISHLLPNLRPQIQLSSMPIRKLQTKAIWCDVCRLAYPKGHVRQQTPAVWQVVSETKKHQGRSRNYCQPCANDAQLWHDGTVWTFRQQLDYALGKEKIDGMELGQL